MNKYLSGIIRYSSFILSGFCLLGAAVSAKGAPDLELYSPYTKISVSPGQALNYTITVVNNSDEIKSADVDVSGLPHGWTYTLKSGGWNIGRISVLPKEKQTLTLAVNVPLKIKKGAYRFSVRAGGYSTLPLAVVVTEEGTYKTALSTKQANLEGAASTAFTFNATLRNETADTQLYALKAEAPPGWGVTFKADYKQVASVSVDPNQEANLTVSVDPPDQVAADTYNIPVYASTGETSAYLPLQVVITGSYDMKLTTPTGLLSTQITAGSTRRIKLVLQNTGSATLKKVGLSFTAPTNWDVTFDPGQVDVLMPGKTTDLFATIKADKNAIPGDYMTDLQAKTAETSSKAEFRVSVRTSMLWGWVGVLIILAALGCVYYLFRKYGRR